MCGSKASRRIVLMILLVKVVSVLGDDYIYNHIFGVTDTGPLARAVGKSEEAKTALRGLLNYYQGMERDMKLKKAENDLIPLAIKFIPPFVNLTGWPVIASSQQLYRSHGAMSAECKARERSVFEDITSFDNGLMRIEPSLRNHNFLDWKKFYTAGSLTLDTDTHSCSMRTSTAYRIHGKWSINARLTNDEANVTKREMERMYVEERLRLDNSGVVRYEPLFLNLSVNNGSKKYWKGAPQESIGKRQLVSSILAIWGGKPGVNQFNTGRFEDNIAYLSILHTSKYLTRQSQDSTTVSNTAILLLPVLIAAFPLALFADVEYIMAFIYMILTDVVTVLPLAVKGIELIVAGESKYFATRTMVYGNIVESSTVVAETWSVKCSSSQNLTRIGVSFVSVAGLAMCGGIFLEFWTRRKVEKLKKVPIFHNNEVSWVRSVPCLDCRCHTEQRAYGVRTFGGGLVGHLQRRNRRRDSPVRQSFMEY